MKHSDQPTSESVSFLFLCLFNHPSQECLEKGKRDNGVIFKQKWRNIGAFPFHEQGPLNPLLCSQRAESESFVIVGEIARTFAKDNFSPNKTKLKENQLSSNHQRKKKRVHFSFVIG